MGLIKNTALRAEKNVEDTLNGGSMRGGRVRGDRCINYNSTE